MPPMTAASAHGLDDDRPRLRPHARRLVPRAGARRRADAGRRPARARSASTTLRGVRIAPVTTVIDDLDAPPAGPVGRLPAPASALPPPRPARTRSTSTASSACWRTSRGRASAPSTSSSSTRVRLRCRAEGRHLEVYGVDKFPRMTDYVVPAGVRIADADRVRLGAHLAEGTTVMHEGFVNYNAGHARRLDGRGAHQRGRRRRRRLGHRRRRVDHGHAERRRQRGHLDRRALPARRQRRHRHLARRRLRRRGRALPHRGHARDAARRRGRQGARAERRVEPALPPQQRDRRRRGAASAAARGAASTRCCTPTSEQLRRALALLERRDERDAHVALAARAEVLAGRDDDPALEHRVGRSPSGARIQRKNDASPPAGSSPASSSAGSTIARLAA